MYAFQTNQIEATMNNQPNCRLTSAKLASVRWRIRQSHFALFYPGLRITEIETMMQYVFIFLKVFQRWIFTVELQTEIT